MFKIFNKTENHVEEASFTTIDEAFDYIKATEYGKDGEVLVIYSQDEAGNQVDLITL